MTTKPTSHVCFHGEFSTIGNIVNGYTHFTVEQKEDAFIIAQHLNVSIFFIWSDKTQSWMEWTGPQQL
jgi:hypothetical protein